MSSQSPRVSFGLPVRNGEASISKCIESILVQDYTDFELVICDNRSTDHTLEILSDYAKKDKRIRVEENDVNLGLVGNFNRVFSRTTGEYFRWIGSDDWLEPGYASKCVKALDDNPKAVVATTYFGLHHEGGDVDFHEYVGKFPDSEDAAHRVARLLYFFRAGAGIYEPMYAMMRRQRLVDAGCFEIHRHQDWLLSFELSLAGPLIHIPECLFHRTWPKAMSSAHYKHLAELYPDRKQLLQPSGLRLMAALNRRVSDAAGLGRLTRLQCNALVMTFALRHAARIQAKIFRKFRRERLGLTWAALSDRNGNE
jgi:glycosyltransferase involved in cell wall biosynthesis